jgi:3-(3-hydroxy-phenyl)propionate hydroxylase
VQREIVDELCLTVVAGRVDGEGPPGWRVIEDAQLLARQRYDGSPGTTYLLRPDQHVAARWRTPTVDKVRAALRRAQGA